MSILDDEFMVSSYLDHHDPKPKAIYGHSKIEDAIRWSTDALRIIIIPTDNLADLEAQWVKFNQMIKKNRRESDWKSIELFGMNNQDHYELIRNKLLDKNIEDDIESDRIPPVQDGDSPVLESYIHPADSYYNADAVFYTTEEVDKARTWAEESNRVIIVPTRNLNDLEALWDDFNMMIKKHRRESDWMSLELFGLTNQHHYEYLKSQFLKEDIRIEDIEQHGSYIESKTSANKKKYIAEVYGESVADASKLMLEMVRPNKSFSEELIVSNIISDAIADVGGLAADVSTVDITYGDMPYFDPEEMIDMGVFNQLPSNNYYGERSDNLEIYHGMSVKDWFDNYYAHSKGFHTEFSEMASQWMYKVRELMHGLDIIKESGNAKRINARKQAILELGWNPDVEFTPIARMIARECAIERAMKYSTCSRVIDLRKFSADGMTNLALNEVSSTSPLYPIYVVFTEGKTPIISDAIRKVTHDIYSHASIAFDATLEKMYSFGMNSEKGIKGGFREENIKDTPIGSRVNVYTFFVSERIYNKIKDMVENFKNNVQKTTYSYKNLFTYLFNIPVNKEWSLICSQFVDRCLKVAEIDITKRDSSLVSPATLHSDMKKESRIYSIYQGLASKYNPQKISHLINALRAKAMPLKEQNKIYLESEQDYISGIVSNIYDIPTLLEMKEYIGVVQDKNTKRILEEVLFDAITIRPYCEAKSFPVQFDKDGNMLIKNLKKIDYESEYSKSHKLLKEYKQAGNAEGMKYEVAKLWMMCCLIEDTLHSKKFQELPSFAIESSAAHKARAKIYNDFQYYLKEIMKIEPNFNFTEYYESSPFSSSSTKINNTTVSFMARLIKKFMKPI